MKYFLLTVLLFVSLLTMNTAMAETQERWQDMLQDSSHQLVRDGFAAEPLSQIDQGMDRAGFTVQERVRVHQELHNAVGQGAPQGELLGKINEGIAKNVSAEQIIAAMERMTGRYTRSQTYVRRLGLAGEPDAADVRQLLVNAQTAGMAAADLERVVSTLQDAVSAGGRKQDNASLIRGSLDFTQEMQRLGVDSRLVADLAESLLQNGADDGDFEDITDSLRKLRSRETIGQQARQCLMEINAGGSVATVRNRLQSRMGGGANQTNRADMPGTAGTEHGARGGTSGQQGSGSGGGGRGNGNGSSGGGGLGGR